MVTSEDSKNLLKKIFKSVSLLNPSKDSVQYWVNINRTMLSYDSRIAGLWSDEKIATTEGIAVSKKIAIEFLCSERARMLIMTKNEAVRALIKMHKIDSRIDQINKVTDNDILSLK